MNLVGKPGFTETAVGWIPKDWQPSTLGCAAHINPSRTKPESDEDDVSFLAMGDVSEDGRVIARQVRSYKEVAKGFTSFIDDDVLVAKITPCFENGKGALVTNLLGGIGFGSTEFHVVRARPDRATSSFLNLHTRSDGFRRLGERNMVGSAGQKRVPAEFLREYPVALPPLPEQQKIAAILTAVDDKLDVIARQIEAAQTLKKGLMQTLFSRGAGTQDANGRWVPHAEFKDSELGEIPVGWRTGELLSFLELQRGFDLPIQNRREGEVPIFGSNGILGFHDLSVCHGPGVITGRSGTIGKVFYTETLYWPLNTSLYVKDFKGNHPKFVYYKLVFIGLGKFSTGTGVPTLNRNVAHKEVVAIPSLREQQEIAAILTSMDDKLDILERRAQATQALKRGLMQKLLTGEWRLRPDASTTST